MARKTKAVIAGTFIALLLLFLASNYLLGSLDYSLKSQQSSPNGQYTVHEFQSLSEGGHAPYGILLSLSPQKSLRYPEDGHIFFAGYCQPPFTYAWKGNNNIFVKCLKKGKEAIQTQAILAFGISIEVESE